MTYKSLESKVTFMIDVFIVTKQICFWFKNFTRMRQVNEQNETRLDSSIRTRLELYFSKDQFLSILEIFS